MNKEIKEQLLAKAQKTSFKSTTPRAIEAGKITKTLDQKLEEEHRAQMRAKKGISREKILYEVIDLYLKGTSTKDIAEKYYYTSSDITTIIDNHIMNLANTRASSGLIEEGEALASPQGKIYPVLEKLKKIEVLNEPFFAKLSPNDSPTLTEEEALFAWIYAHKGDSKEALEMSTLEDGLIKEQAVTYRRGVFSRALYLQNKPNVAQYIKELREARYLTEDITKQGIQQMLLEQIEFVKQRGDKRDSVHLRQLIELLGKTIGAFTERVEIQEVNPSKSLDLLIEMAKEASVKELVE